MPYDPPYVLEAYNKSYNAVKRCPDCGSSNIEKWQGRDATRDLVLCVQCKSCGKEQKTVPGSHWSSWT